MSISFDEVMAFHPDNVYVYEEIKSCLGQLLPFVGAGLTADVYGTWSGVLRELGRKLTDPSVVGELGALLDACDFFGAAQLLEEWRGTTNFARDLVHHFSPKKLDMDWDKVQNGALWLLPNLFACPVLTTNFDQAIERVYREKGFSDFERIDPFSCDLRSQASGPMVQPCVFKLHGTVVAGMVDYSKLVFTRKQYKVHYGPTGEARETLRDFVGRRALLFLGCSLGKDATVDVLREAAVPDVTHYAIVSCEREERDSRIRELAKFGIRAIVYEDGKHDSVRIVLGQLLEEKQSTSQNAAVNETKEPSRYSGTGKNDSNKQRVNSFGTIIIAINIITIIILLAISISILCTQNNSPIDETVTSSPMDETFSVGSSYVEPYTEAGSVIKSRNLGNEFSRAFCLVNYLNNASNQSALVESTRVDITELEPIENPNVLLKAAISDNALYAFAINDGWGVASEAIDASLSIQLPSSVAGSNKDYQAAPFAEVCKTASIADALDLEPAAVSRVARLV